MQPLGERARIEVGRDACLTSPGVKAGRRLGRAVSWAPGRGERAGEPPRLCNRAVDDPG